MIAGLRSYPPLVVLGVLFAATQSLLLQPFHASSHIRNVESLDLPQTAYYKNLTLSHSKQFQVPYPSYIQVSTTLFSLETLSFLNDDIDRE